jgi:hypothetical protein
VTTTTLATAVQGQTNYSQTLTSSGGTAPFVWSLFSGSLSSGLGLSSTGVISGTVGAAATSQTFTVAVTDKNGGIGTKSLTLTVNPAITISAITVTSPGKNLNTFSGTTTANTGTLTVNVYAGSTATGTVVKSYTITSFGSSSPYTWSVTTGNSDLKKNSQFTAQASQTDAAGHTSNLPTVTFTAS